MSVKKTKKWTERKKERMNEKIRCLTWRSKKKRKRDNKDERRTGKKSHGGRVLFEKKYGWGRIRHAFRSLVVHLPACCVLGFDVRETLNPISDAV